MARRVAATMSSMMRPIVAALCGFVLGFALAVLTCGGGEPAPASRAPAPILVPPLQDAEVGEWIRIQAGRDVQVHRVVDARELDVTIEYMQYHEDEPGPPATIVLRRDSFGTPAEGVVRAIARDRVDVGGRSYDCWRLDVYLHIGQFAYWISEEVPVTGLIKYARIEKGAVDEVKIGRASCRERV